MNIISVGYCALSRLNPKPGKDLRTIYTVIREEEKQLDATQ
jgi:hypothetical protein